MIVKKTKHIVWILFVYTLKTLANTQDTIYTYSHKFLPKDYKSNYTSNDYIYEKTAPGFLDILLEKLASLFLKFLQSIGANTKNLETYKTVFYFIVAIIAVYIIAKMFLQKEGQWIFRKTKQNNTLVYDTEVNTIETTNFKEVIQKTTKKQQYRLVVKYYYLWVLQKLSEKDFIELNNLKTNADYQLEIEETKFDAQFKNISYYYNYVWYGEFEIDLDSFQKIEPIFLELLNSIDHEK